VIQGLHGIVRDAGFLSYDVGQLVVVEDQDMLRVHQLVVCLVVFVHILPLSRTIVLSIATTP
jgi:hypothetical protein